MRFATWIAWRYLKSRSHGRYAKLLTVTAVLSVAIGMLSLILVMSVMRGFRINLAGRFLGFNSHITLVRSDGAAPLSKKDVGSLLGEGVDKDIAAFVEGEVIAELAGIGEPVAQGARVRGIEPGSMKISESIEYYFPEDSAGFDELRDVKFLPAAIVGKDVASQISVHPDFGDEIELVAPLAEIMPNGELGPNKMRFSVAGIFRAGIFDYDSKYILVSESAARKLLGLQAREGWQIRLEDSKNIQDALVVLKSRLPDGWEAKGWNEQNKKLFAALKLERVAMGGVLFMVMLIASFAIVGVILLVTAAKRKDIAVLESMGLSKRGICAIFLSHAAFIGGIGSALGFAGGMVICFILEKYPMRLPASYYLDWLPVDLNPIASVVFALAGVLIAVAAAIYPAGQAMKQNTAEVLRYE